MKVSINRVMTDLKTFNQFNTTLDNGCTRFSFTDEDRKVKDYLIAEMKKIGMETWFDGVGNLHGLLKGNGENRKTLLSGSHIDTVTNGGIYDGNLGVVGALEVARTLVENGVTPYHNFQVSAFVEEEGPHFGTNLIGSKAFCKQFSTEKAKEIKDINGKTMYEVMKEGGYNPEEIDNMTFEPENFLGNIELHIEQGRVLDLEKKSVGIVKGIVGLKWFRITIKGESNHAGATPMRYRLDPVAEGTSIISQLPSIVKSINDDSIVATVGKINVFPNQTNIIPNTLEFTIDLRGIEEENLFSVKKIIDEKLEELRSKGFSCEIEQIAGADAVKSDINILSAIEKSLEERGYTYTSLYSGANHDTSILGQSIPSAMIFVPSVDGRSHCKEEFTEEKDIEAGCQILCDTVYKLIK